MKSLFACFEEPLAIRYNSSPIKAIFACFYHGGNNGHFETLRILKLCLVSENTRENEREKKEERKITKQD